MHMHLDALLRVRVSCGQVKSVQSVRREYEDVLRQHPHIDLAQVAAARTLSEFDNFAIAPMFGCACATDYYREASAGNYLSRIAIPMLFLSADNDPIAPARLLRCDNFDGGVGPSAPKALLLAVTDEGGHSMTWPEGWYPSGTWSVGVITEFVQAALQVAATPSATHGRGPE